MGDVRQPAKSPSSLINPCQPCSPLRSRPTILGIAGRVGQGTFPHAHRFAAASTTLTDSHLPTPTNAGPFPSLASPVGPTSRPPSDPCCELELEDQILFNPSNFSSLSRLCPGSSDKREVNQQTREARGLFRAVSRRVARKISVFSSSFASISILRQHSRTRFLAEKLPTRTDPRPETN